MSREVERLLATLDPLPHPARLRQAALAARSFAADGALDSVLAELDGLGPYERRLGALLALAGRRTKFLAARLGDPDQVVRGCAMRAARTLPVPDGAIEAAYADASEATRRGLARVVLAGHRTALAERLVGRLRTEWGDAEAARLLPACSAGFVARLLPELGHAVGSWPRLARSHPGPVLDHAERDLAARPHDQRDIWWRQHGDGVAAVASVRPEGVLALLERYGPELLPGALRERLGALVAADAERTVRVLISLERGARYPRAVPPPAVLRRLVRADPPSLTALGRHWLNSPRYFAGLLKAVPPRGRGDFFDAATAGIEVRSDHVLPVLELLPYERRWAEVRRWVPRGREEAWFWVDVLEPAARGPVAEARPELLAALRRPDPEDRALVWPLLIANAAVEAAGTGDPAVTHELLALMGRLRNEQDPVRAAALEALAEQRPGLFTAEDTGPLERIVRDALEARDSSPRTRNAVRRLAVGVLRENAVRAADGEPALLAWALHALERLAGHVGAADLGALDRTLRRGQEHQVFEALRPWLEAAGDKADYRPLFALTGALGKRAHGMEPLQDLLEEALKYGDDAAFTTAATYWLAPSGTRHARVERVLALEPSAAFLYSVQEVLTSRRTDLLDPLLGDAPPYGRFQKRGTRRPLPALGNAGRWLPRQQAAAVALAAAVAGDESRALYERAAAITAAAPLDVHGRALALRYADAPEVVLAEAALGALVWTGRPAETLPLLLGHAGGDRARVAVYAAGRAARFTAPSVLADRLGGPLTAARGVKVTSRKEAVRLAARHLPARGAAALLATAYRAPEQHPDVRAAVVAAATELLGEEEVWAVLTDASHGSPDAPQVLQALVRAAPWSLAEAHRPRYARLIGAVCRAADDEAAVAALSVLPRWAGYAPESADSLVGTVGDLDGRARWRAAAGALAALAVSGLPHPLGGAAPGSLFHRALADLLAVHAGEGTDAAYRTAPDRDLPALQRVRTLLGKLPVVLLPSLLEAGVPAVLEAVAEQLVGEPSFVPDRAELLCRLIDLDDGPDVLTAQLRALAGAAGGRPVLAAALAARLGGRRYGYRLPREPATVLAVAERSAATGGTADGLLAVALVKDVGHGLGWPGEWRTALRALRRHPVADVRDAALGFAVEQE
ncbi:hypothetical protein [Streptomyces sp. NPDC093109]|uniref:hypothetical protein n=1 Tax=Streptomyces sp. NPDC093109 TaxID=3154977 RepID=UPI003450B3BD